MDELLQVTDLVKHFPAKGGLLSPGSGAVQAVDGVSFNLSAGETLGIVGESGCGKSTLSRLLVRLINPTHGSIRFQGQELTSLRGRDLRAARRQIQMVFQDPFASLDPRMTVAEIVAEPLRAHGEFNGRDGERRVQDLLDRVGLSPDQSMRFPHEFSGGQRQRIAIARALALHPRVLVLDEPVSALDVSTQANVINLLMELQEDLGLAYVFVAHNLAVVRQIADRVAVMYLGKFAEEGDTAEVYGDPRHPYTQALLSAVPITDPDHREGHERRKLAGDPPSPIDPPRGCRFQTRCWLASEACMQQEPPLLKIDRAPHAAACHFAAQNANPANPTTS